MHVREQLRSEWERLDAMMRARSPAFALHAEFSAWMDRLVIGIFHSTMAEMPEGDQPLVVALGGYGRRELAPHSDLDLMFLVSAAGGDAASVSAMLYPLWDTGIEVSSATRSIAEALAMLRQGDLRTQTALLDARYLVGPTHRWTLFVEGMQGIRHTARWRRQFVRGKQQELVERHRRYGALPFFLEPNIKEGEGGLRDWHLLCWIGMAVEAMATPRDLLARRWVSEAEWEQLSRAVAFLQTLRWHLHRVAGRREERLGFAEQEQLASHPGLVAGAATPEALMQRYYASAAAVRDFTNWLCWTWDTQGWRSWYRRVRLAVSRRGWCVVGGRVAVHPRAVPSADAVVTLLHGAARVGKALDPPSRHLLRRVARQWPDVAITSALLGPLFAEPAALSRLLWELHRTHWLTRVFPEFAHLHYRTQRDAYHCYTIDTHLLQAVAECAALITDSRTGNDDAVADAVAHLRSVHCVLLAVLYHDVGKGKAGRHHDVGATMVAAAARRCGWPDAEVALTQFVVRSHQLMPTLAFRRDLTDASMIDNFAQAIGSAERLAALYLLSIADLKAVGPNVYTQWKQSLLAELYQRTLASLRGTADKRPSNWRIQLTQAARGHLSDDAMVQLLPRWVDAMPERYLREVSADALATHVQMWYRFGEAPLVWNVTTRPDGLMQVDMLMRDQAGLFATCCGVMAAHGVSIASAQAFTGDHQYVLDRFCCTMPTRMQRGAGWEVLKADVAAVLKGYQDVATLLARRPTSLLQRRRLPSAGAAVHIDNAVSEELTVVEVKSPDRLGLLYGIAHHLYAQGFRILGAKVATAGGHVRDAFYIQDFHGVKVTDPMALEQLQATLLSVVEGA